MLRVVTLERHWRRGACLLLTMLVVTGLVRVDPVFGSDPTQSEEFVGPFASWRQVQCTGQDDTALLQNELNTLGRTGSPVLYIQSGTCRITSTLHLGQGAGGADGVIHVTLLGHDPADTHIVWAGPAGRDQKMFEVTGVAQSRFGRLTWDGGGGADIVYYDDWPNTSNYFPTGNRHEDEVFQNMLPGGGIAFFVGALGFGGSEWEYIRCKFIGSMQAGIYLANFNALNHWVWDSLFQNVQHGVTNYLPDRPVGAGGDWGVNRSVFLNNGDNMAIANTSFFSSRWNYSRGSAYHVHSYPIGAAPSPWTSQGETVIDPTSTNPPFLFGSTGAAGVLDATIRNAMSDSVASVVEGYSDHPGGDLWAVGNTLRNPNPAVYSVGTPEGRSHASIDDNSGQDVADPGPPALPDTPAPSTAPVIEVQNGDIASALAQAGNARAIVHIPYGNYQVASPLEVGSNVILTGDGESVTNIESVGADPILHLAGPSHAVLRDFGIAGQKVNPRSGSGIVIDNADQPGGTIHSENGTAISNDIGWDVSNLSQTTVDLLDDGTGSNSHADTSGAGSSVDYRVSNGKLHIFDGVGSKSDALYELHGGELISQTHYYEGDPNGVASQLIVPGSSGTLVLDIGSFSTMHGGIDTSSFQGLFTMIGVSTMYGPRRFGPNSLVMGYDFGWKDDTSPPTFSGPPYALWLPRHSNGGGSDLVPEQQDGISNAAEFMREHLAALRKSVPLPLTGQPQNVTDVRLYRVGAAYLHAGVRVTG